MTSGPKDSSPMLFQYMVVSECVRVRARMCVCACAWHAWCPYTRVHVSVSLSLRRYICGSVICSTDPETRRLTSKILVVTIYIYIYIERERETETETDREER